MALKLVRDRNNPKGNWYIRGSFNGRRIEESTRTSNRKKAEEAKARREGELLDASIHGVAAVATFAHACKAYLENGGESRFIPPLLNEIGTTRLSKINQALVEDLANKLLPGRADSTKTRQVFTPMRAIMRHAAKRDMVQYKVFEGPKQPDARTRWLTPAEAERLLAACRKHLRPIVALMLYTGARLSEALFLDWKQLDLERGVVLYLETKTGKPRGVPLHPVLIEMFRPTNLREGPVFRTHKGLPYTAIDEGGGQIKKGFRAAVERAGLGWYETVDGKDKPVFRTDVTPHICRHTWATWHYLAHRDLRMLMELGGWSQISMVQRYTHVNPEHHAPSIQALPTLGVNWGTVKTSKAKNVVVEQLTGT